MRFGRIILAGLAPLVGLSAFAAGLLPHACGTSNSAQQISNPESRSASLRRLSRRSFRAWSLSRPPLLKAAPRMQFWLLDPWRQRRFADHSACSRA